MPKFKLEPYDYVLENIRKVFQPGLYMVNRRPSSCYGSSRPLNIFVKILAVKVKYCRPEKGDDLRIYHLDLKVKALTVSHGMRFTLPVDWVRVELCMRGAAVVGISAKQGWSQFITYQNPNRRLVTEEFNFKYNDPDQGGIERDFNLGFATAREMRSFRSRVKKLNEAINS